MPQSSALRREATNPTPITINSQDVPNPKDAKITNDGSVTFNAAQACWLYSCYSISRSSNLCISPRLQ